MCVHARVCSHVEARMMRYRYMHADLADVLAAGLLVKSGKT